ncbi:unnamed protein product, partial [Hapterophycus canaliculatus]
MAKFITQETFDEVVKENMEDFGMDRESAAEDAVGQFKAQGADLSRVDTSADGIRKDARATVNDIVEKLRGFGLDRDSSNAEAEDGSPTSHDACVQALDSVAELCREDGAAGEANKMAVGEAGGVGMIARFLHADQQDSSPQSVVLAALSALSDVCRNSERNRDAFIYTNMEQLTTLLLHWTSASEGSNNSRSSTDNSNGKDDAIPCCESAKGKPSSGDDEDGGGGGGGGGGGQAADMRKDTAALVAAGLKVVRTVCTKAENNKGSFMRRKGAAVLVASLRRYGGAGDSNGNSDNSKNAAVTKEACAALRSVTMGDDRRKDFSGTYDNVKALVSAGAIPLLLDAARAFEDDSTTLSVIYLALKQLAANDESVKLVRNSFALDRKSGDAIVSPRRAFIVHAALS